MFTFGWSEIFLIGIIVVVVIGPKDLPKFIKQEQRDFLEEGVPHPVSDAIKECL